MNRFARVTGFFVCLMVILAVLARGLIPSGFMPVQGDDGKVEIVICTATGLTKVLVDAHGAPHMGDGTDGDTGHTMQICPFAPVLAFGALPPMPDFTPPVQAARAMAFFYKSVALSRLEALAYQAQAPPVLS